MIKFKLEGVQATIKDLKAGQKLFEDKVDKLLQNGVVMIERDAKRNAPTYIGAIKQSIQHANIAPLKWEVAANAYHAPYIEFGTKLKVNVPAGMEAIAAAVKSRPKKGNYKQFVDALTEWIKKRGIAATQIKQVSSGARKGQFQKAGSSAQRNYERQLAHLMAIRILQNGIRPQPFLYPALMANVPKIKADLKQLVDEQSR